MFIIIRNLITVILCMTVIICLYDKFAKEKCKPGYAACLMIYAVNVTLIAYLTGVTMGKDFSFNIDWSTVSFVPFDGIKAVSYYGMSEYALINILGNVVLFMPIGFFVPLLSIKFRKIYKTGLFGIVVSIAIEVFQLFISRGTDIDDVILNTIGTIVGYLVFVLLRKVIKGEKISLGRYERVFLFIGTTIPFLCNFILGFLDV